MIVFLSITSLPQGEGIVNNNVICQSFLGPLIRKSSLPPIKIKPRMITIESKESTPEKGGGKYDKDVTIDTE